MYRPTSASAIFLDRDGVLNRLRRDDYVKTPDELEVLDGVVLAMERLKALFCKVFIVTNQQGIGKGLMTEQDLQAAHEKLIKYIGDVDRIYYCPLRKEAHSFMRKPNIGMALQARRDFPGINLKESVMVGDSWSDMLFGRRAGMTTVVVGRDGQSIAQQYPYLVDYCYDDLLKFALSIEG